MYNQTVIITLNSRRSDFRISLKGFILH